MHFAGPERVSTFAYMEVPMNTMTPRVAGRLLNRRELRLRLPVSGTTIARWEKAGRFPKHVTVNGRNYWREDEIIAWQQQLSRDSN
jgi:predicted DNA-binding transcriptional regulator AlpA